VARLGGLAALALVGALEWQRMAQGLTAGRAVVWVVVAVAVAVALLAARRLQGRAAAWAPLGVTLAGLLAAFAASPLELRLLRPKHWPELADGIGRGLEAVGTVRLPYAGSDEWTPDVIALGGSLLCVLAALLAFWPRGEEPGRAGERTAGGYPFFSLLALMTLLATPVIAVGGTRPLGLGGIAAALVVAFLWLERLPLRPGVGVAVLLGLAVAGGVPLATVTDREEPWFDYKGFAEGFGSGPPVRFDFASSRYGPIDWSRDGGEVFRVRSDEPQYWKVRTLGQFNGEGWEPGNAPEGVSSQAEPELDLAEDFGERPEWDKQFKVTIRRVRGREVIGAGTVLGVENASRPVRPTALPGIWVADTDLRAGDAYTVRAHIPAPKPEQLEAATAGTDGRQPDALEIVAPFAYRNDVPPKGTPTAPRGTPVRSALLRFPPFEARETAPVALYPTLEKFDTDGGGVLRRTRYRRTWELAQRLKSRAETPYAYVQAVDAYLESGFTYSERPDEPGEAPLEQFLFDTRTGYCQHFAGAMALLLRMGGVPARVVQGFSPGGFSKRKDAWIIRDTDAHAWVEAWFDDYGWVVFDPTPAVTPARSQIAALDAATPATPEETEADTPAADPTADPADAGVRADLLRDSAAGSADAEAAGGDGTPWWAYALGGTGLVALAGGGLLLRRRRRGPRAVPSRIAADRALAELELALRRSGRPVPLGTTLRSLEGRIATDPEALEYLRAIRAARYADTAPKLSRSGRAALRRDLAAGLGYLGWLRALWALPPRPDR
jgi:transglutaminase-like putative cysteine protease